MKQNWKRYSFWTGLSAAIVLIADRIFSIFGISVVSATEMGEIVMAICSVLVVLGIVSKTTETKNKNSQVLPNVEQTAETTNVNSEIEETDSKQS